VASFVANFTLIARDWASALQLPFGQPILLASAGFIRSPKKIECVSGVIGVSDGAPNTDIFSGLIFSGLITTAFPGS
jgi:hypothetical protein